MTSKFQPSSDQGASNPTQETNDDRLESSAGEETPPDLTSELVAARLESEQWQDRFMRKAAELENYRKRMERERGETAILSKVSVLEEFLPIVDACERALQSFESSQDTVEQVSNYRQGVELLYKQFSDTLVKLGVIPIDAKGQPFDPHLHEALAMEESADHEENTVLEELRRGYMYKDRLLRPVQVKVATRPQGENGSKN